MLLALIQDLFRFWCGKILLIMDEIAVSTKTFASSQTKSNVHSYLLSLLLSVHYLPGYVNLILNLISEIQISALLTLQMTEHFASIKQDSGVLGAKNLASALTFQFSYDFSGEDDFTNAITIIIGVYFLFILIVALVLAVLYVLCRSSGTLLPRIWSALGSLHSTTTFLFIQFFASSLLKDLVQEEKLKDKNAAIGIAAAYMSLGILFGLISSWFKIDLIKDNDPMATRTAWFSVLGLLYKLAMSLCVFLITNDTIKHCCCFLMGVVFLSCRLYQYMTEFPFYNCKVFKTFLAIAVCQQAQVGLNLFWWLVSQKRKVSLTIIFSSYIVFGAILIHVGHSYVYWTIRRDAIKQTVKSEKEFFKKMFSWEKIIETRASLNQSQRNEYGVLFRYLVERHAKHCATKDCGCKYVLFQRSLERELFKENDKINMDLDSLNYELIKGLYEEGIKDVSQNSLIKLQFANFLISNDEKSITNAIYLVNSAKSRSSLFDLEITTLKNITLSKIENQIENTFKSQRSGLQTKQFVDYYIQKSKFRREVAENTKLYIDFWASYSNPNPVIQDLLKQNIKINQKAEKLKVSWDNLSVNHSRFCHQDYLINALYMQMIRNAPYTAETLFSRYYSYQSELTHSKSEKEIFNHYKDIFLCISLNQEKFARVVFASQNVKRLGYGVDELKDHTVGMLMPLFFARKYNKFLLKEITQNCFYRHLNKEISVFIRDKKGNVRLAMLYLTVFPYLKQGFYCLARIRLEKKKKNNLDNYLLMLANGKIEGGTRDISEKLKLDDGNVTISDICLSGNQLFGYKEEMESQEATPKDPFRSALERVRADDNTPRSKCSNSPRNLRLSKFQKFNNSPKNLSDIARSLKEKGFIKEGDHTERPGVKLKFFSYQKNREPQEAIISHWNYMAYVSTRMYDDQVLYIIRLTEIKDSVKNSPKKKKALNSSRWDEEKNDTPSNSEVEMATIPNESERNHVRLPPPSPGVSFLEVGVPQILLSQERLLSAESENPITDRRKSFVRRATTRKVEHEDNLKTERRKLVENIQSVSEGSSNISRMNAREANFLMKMERAIHQNKIPVSYTLVKMSVIGFIILSIVLFAYFQIEGNVKFDLLVNNMNILEYSLAILYYTNECTRSVTPVKLIDLGYIPQNRNGGGVFDWWLIHNFGYIVPNLTQANNNLMDSMSYFSEEQRNKFYELIPVIQQDTLNLNPKENAFDIHTQLASSAIRLYNALPKIPANDNPDLNFIFNNTINDLLIHDREIFSLLQEEDKRIVNAMANFVLTLLGVMVGTGIVVIVVLIRSEVRFIKKKMLFLDHFLRIGEGNVRSIIRKSTHFYEALRDSNYNEEDVLSEVESLELNAIKSLSTEDEMNTTLRNQQNFLNKKKKASLKSINKDSWIGVLTLMAFIFWFWLAYGIFYSEFIRQNNITQAHKSQIIETSLYLSHYSQALLYLYIYLGGLGEINVQGKSIKTHWDENYAKLIQFNTYFANMMNTEYSVKYDKTIKILLN